MMEAFLAVATISPGWPYLIFALGISASLVPLEWPWGGIIGESQNLHLGTHAASSGPL